jgi:hypothetical protein
MSPPEDHGISMSSLGEPLLPSVASSAAVGVFDAEGLRLFVRAGKKCGLGKSIQLSAAHGDAENGD